MAASKPTATMATTLLFLILMLSPEMVTAGRSRSRRRRVQHMEFYMHDILKARHPTAFLVLQPVNDTNGNGIFGAMAVIDDKLTEGPDPNSREIGRVQGTYTSASLSTVQLFIAVTAVFHDDGSTLSFQGSDRIFEETRDISIVGGTGRFKFARGFATMRTFSIDPPNAILGFNCTITY